MNILMVILIAVAVVLLVFPLVIFYRKRSKEKHREKIEKVFCSILDGNYEPVEDRVRAEADYSDWLIRQDSIFRRATKEMFHLRKELMAEGKWYSLRAEISHERPSGKVQVVIGNAFTEFFPSTHDLDTWAICTKATDLLVLTGKTVETSREYYIHIKNHFANHKMVMGIMQFDVYRLVA
jgi:hypothetical protein